MPSYKELKTQIAKLQQEAEAALRKEKDDVVSRIHALMDDYHLTLGDLRRTSKSAVAKTAQKVAAKYRNPLTGVTWSGRGRAPAWVKEAIKRGTQETLQIAKPSQSQALPAAKPVVPVAKIKTASGTTAKAKKPTKAMVTAQSKGKSPSRAKTPSVLKAKAPVVTKTVKKSVRTGAKTT